MTVGVKQQRVKCLIVAGNGPLRKRVPEGELFFGLATAEFVRQRIGHSNRVATCEQQDQRCWCKQSRDVDGSRMQKSPRSRGTGAFAD